LLNEPQADGAAVVARATPGRGRSFEGAHRRRLAGTAAVTLLATVGLLLVLAAVPAVWLRGQLLDTDRYLAAVAPLGADPLVQDEVASKVSAAIDQRLEQPGTRTWAQDKLPPVAQPFTQPLVQVVRQIVEQLTDRYTHSPEFEQLWVTLNRTAHQQVVAILTGRPAVGGGVRLDPSGQLWLDLGPVIEQVKQKLVAAGLPAASRLPTTSATVKIGRVAGVDRARTAGRWLGYAAWLPWLAGIFLLASIALARRRRRTILVVGLGIVAAMLALRVGLAATRDATRSAVPPQALSSAVVGHLFDQVTAGLRATVRIVAFLGGLVAAAAIVVPISIVRIRAHLRT
jgi:hypothetical protein